MNPRATSVNPEAAPNPTPVPVSTQPSTPTPTLAPAPATTQAPTPNFQRRQGNRARQSSSPRQPPIEPMQRRRQRQRGNGSGQQRPTPIQRQQEQPQQRRNQSNGYRSTKRFIPPRMQSQDWWPEPTRQYQNWFFRDEQHWPTYANAVRRPRPRPPPSELDWPELPRGRYAAPQPWYPEYH